MNILVPALLWSICAAALCFALLLIGCAVRRIHTQAVLPGVLMFCQALGQQLLPNVLFRSSGAVRQGVFSLLDRELRLGGLAPQVSVADWLRVPVGAAVLCAVVALAVQRLLRDSHGVVVDLAAAAAAAGCGAALVQRWLLQRRRVREASLLRELPVGLELIALSIECGCALIAALELAAHHLPAGAMRELLAQLRADLASGRARSVALRRLFESNKGSVIAPTLGALVQAEAAGSSLAPVLRAQAKQRTEERFAAAEKAALQAPVKMLLPLITCIFPCTFLVIAFPLVTRFAQ